MKQAFLHDPKIFFSLVIPAHNRANLISATLKSALNQLYSNYEIIVVDDGSTDNTEEVVQGFTDPRISYFKKAHGERGAARNFGFNKSSGKYVTFLDSDDILYPNYFSNAYESLLSNGSPPFLHSGYEVKSPSGKPIRKINYLKSDDTKFILRGNDLSCIGVFIRRDIFNEYKFVEDVGIAGSEDWELWVRIISRHGFKSDPRISSCLIDHSGRSVAMADEDTLLKRKELVFEYLHRDEHVNKILKKNRKKMTSFFDIYIALHLSLSGTKWRSVSYLMNALLSNPALIGDKRIYGVIKSIVK